MRSSRLFRGTIFGSIGCLLAAATLGTARVPLVPADSLAWTIESMTPDVALATTPVGSWDHPRLNAHEREVLEGVQGINVQRSRLCIVRFSLRNETGRSFLISHEDIDRLCRPRLTDETGREWTLKLNVRGHPDGDVHGFPSVADQARAGTRLLTADLVPVDEAKGEAPRPLPNSLTYRVDTRASAREVVGKKLQPAISIPVRGEGTFKLELGRVD